MKRTLSLPQFLSYKFSLKVLGCLGLVALADYFFFGEGPRHFGWTLGFWMIALICVIGMCRRWKSSTRAVAWLIGGITFTLALSLIENPNLLAFFLIVIGLLSLTALHNAAWLSDTFRWLQHLVVYGVMSWGRIFVDIWKSIRAGKKSKSISFKWIGYCLIPAFFSILFLILFYIANPVIHEWLEHFYLREIIHLFSPRRWIYWFLIAWISWGLIRPKMYRLVASDSKEEVAPPKLNQPVYDFFFNTTSIAVALIFFNLIFSLQTILDLLYLWTSRTLPEGLTYAEYAHRGAYPLIFVALLAALFVLIALRPNSASERNSAVRAFVFLWILQTVFLVASSVWRTWLYIEEFSLTYLRISALIWMGLIAAGLLFIIVRILLGKTNRWLVNINLVTLLAILYICSWLDFSSMIAWYNVRHSYEITGKNQQLDLDYMKELGPPALPALRWYIDEVDNSKPSQSKTYSNERITVEVTTVNNGWPDSSRQRAIATESELYENLTESLVEWRGWTWRKQRILDNLQAAVPYREGEPGEPNL